MKVLMLLSRVPYPLEKGDKLRAFNQLKELSKSHDVVLVCLNANRLHSKAKEALEPYCSSLHIIQLNRLLIYWNLFLGLWNKKPFQVHYFYQKRAQKQLSQIIEHELPAHIYVQLLRTAEYVKAYSFIPNTLDYMDAFSTGVARRVQHSIPGLKQLFLEEADRLKVYESSIFKYFTNKTIISEQDRDLIDHPDKEEIHIIRNGVDFDFFHPIEKKKKYDLLFCGNMAYPPNVKAAQFLANEILPIIHKTRPETTLLIAGATPVHAVKQLANKHVYVPGWMEDIRDAYAESRIFIAPMQIGTGLQNKLLESMAMKLPSITSPLANRALNATPETEILIGENAQEYASHCLDLLNNTPKMNQLANAGNKYVNQYFSWASNSSKLLELIQQD